MLQQRRLEQTDAHRVRRRLAERAVVAKALGDEQLHDGRGAGGPLGGEEERALALGLEVRLARIAPRRRRVRRILLAHLDDRIGGLEMRAPRGVVQRRERRALLREEGCAEPHVGSLALAPAAAVTIARAHALQVRRALEGTLPKLPLAADELGRSRLVVRIHPAVRAPDILFAPDDPLGGGDGEAVARLPPLLRAAVLGEEEPAATRAVDGAAKRVAALGRVLDTVIWTAVLAEGLGEAAQMELHGVHAACVEERRQTIVAPVGRSRVQREQLQSMTLGRPLGVTNRRGRR